MRLLRSQSPRETLAFWTVLILSYLTLALLAGLRGIGYSEHVDTPSKSITFEFNPFLWLPDVFLHADPSTNPVPFMLWWVLVATLTAGVVMILFRLFFRPGARARAATTAPSQAPSRPREANPR